MKLSIQPLTRPVAVGKEYRLSMVECLVSKPKLILINKHARDFWPAVALERGERDGRARKLGL